jgi:deazaflavin-dependent oxidoreductase (nitroreductase family)
LTSPELASTPPPPRLARLHGITHFVNPILRRFVWRLPYFGLLSYRGRKSGKTYRIPMNVFRAGDDYIFALTYGHEVQWVKNVLATGEAEIRIGDRVIALTDPELFVDPERRLMPLPVRFFLGLARVHGFIRMRPRGQAGEYAGVTVGRG